MFPVIVDSKTASNYQDLLNNKVSGEFMFTYLNISFASSICPHNLSFQPTTKRVFRIPITATISHAVQNKMLEKKKRGGDKDLNDKKKKKNQCDNWLDTKIAFQTLGNR